MAPVTLSAATPAPALARPRPVESIKAPRHRPRLYQNPLLEGSAASDGDIVERHIHKTAPIFSFKPRTLRACQLAELGEKSRPEEILSLRAASVPNRSPSGSHIPLLVEQELVLRLQNLYPVERCLYLPAGRLE